MGNSKKKNKKVFIIKLKTGFYATLTRSLGDLHNVRQKKKTVIFRIIETVISDPVLRHFWMEAVSRHLKKDEEEEARPVRRSYCQFLLDVLNSGLQCPCPTSGFILYCLHCF